MTWYSMYFERIYAVFHKGASVDPKDDKFDGAMLSCFFAAFPLLMNLLLLDFIYYLYFGYSILKYLEYLILILCILSFPIFNLVYYLPKKKYLKLNEEMVSYPKRKRKKITIVSWTYFGVSIILFYGLLIMLNITK